MNEDIFANLLRILIFVYTFALSNLNAVGSAVRHT